MEIILILKASNENRKKHLMKYRLQRQINHSNFISVLDTVNYKTLYYKLVSI